MLYRPSVAKHHEHLGHLFWEISARLSSIGEARFTALDLSRPALGIMDIVWSTPGISIAEIARMSPKTQQAVSQIVARLESLALIERRLVKGRTIGLYLTQSGTKMRTEGNALEVALEKDLEAALGHDRYERLRKLLLEVHPIVAKHAAGDAKRRPVKRRKPGR